MAVDEEHDEDADGENSEINNKNNDTMKSKQTDF